MESVWWRVMKRKGSDEGECVMKEGESDGEGREWWRGDGGGGSGGGG